MDELIKQVAKKAGINEAQAKQAVTVVLNFLKERLPAPIAAQVDAIIANPGLAAGLGSILGNK